MKRFLLAAAASALVSGTGAAWADQTFALGVSGAGSYQFTTPSGAIGVPGGCDYSVDPASVACVYGIVDIDYTGALQVITSSAADGTYAIGSGLDAVTLSSGFAGWPISLGFEYHAGDSQTVELTPFGELHLGLAPGAYVTISGGHIAALVAQYATDAAQWSFGTDGMTFQSVALAIPDRDSWHVSGVLSPLPESDPAALFVLALCAIAVAGRSPLKGKSDDRSRSRHDGKRHGAFLVSLEDQLLAASEPAA